MGLVVEAVAAVASPFATRVVAFAGLTGDGWLHGDRGASWGAELPPERRSPREKACTGARCGQCVCVGGRHAWEKNLLTCPTKLS